MTNVSQLCFVTDAKMNPVFGCQPIAVWTTAISLATVDAYDRRANGGRHFNMYVQSNLGQRKPRITVCSIGAFCLFFPLQVSIVLR